MFSRGFKDIITKTAIFKEFPGLENKFQNSRGFKEIKDSWEPCVHTSLVTMPLIIVKQDSTLTGRGVARSLDDSDGGGVMLLLLLSCRRSSVMSRPVFGSTIARPRFSRFWYGPPPPVDIGRCCCCCGCCCCCCWGCCGGCCGCCGCCCCCCGTCCCCCCGGCCWTAATIVGCCCCVG